MLTVFPCFFSLPKIMANVYNFYWFIELARPNMPKVYKRVSEVALLSDIVINSVGIFGDVLCRWTFWGTSARTDMAMSMVWAELPATCWFLGFDSRISQISQPDSPGKCLCSGTYWSIDREDETAAVWFTQHVDMPLGRLHRCQRATASVMRKGLKGPSLAEWVAQRVQRIWGLHESSVSSSLFAFCFFLVSFGFEVWNHPTVLADLGLTRLDSLTKARGGRNAPCSGWITCWGKQRRLTHPIHHIYKGI
jgi:hypothetical protein